ncbi:class I SAM-dependent methyltransferase, partial [Patescibacteria group bacterium]|nr:class I SAM-dependent methyltransferase [Patescibacteria group bacterium]
SDGIVFAVDIQRNVLEQMDKLAKHDQIFNIKPVWADIEKYGAAAIQDASVDLTLLINNLFLVKDYEQLTREMARLAKPGSRIAVVDWKTIDTPLGPPTDLRISKDEAKKVFDILEFRFIEEFVPGTYHYGLLFERTDQTVK